MNHSSKLLLATTVSLACTHESNDEWVVTDRGSMGELAVLDVDVGSQTVRVGLRETEPRSAVDLDSALTVIAEGTDLRYFDASEEGGSLDLASIDDGLSLQVLEAAVRGELVDTSTHFRLDADEFAEQAAKGACAGGCDVIGDACWSSAGDDQHASNQCTLGWMGCTIQCYWFP